MLRKTLAGLTVVASALIANPFTHADAANGPSGAFRNCVNQGRAARTQAQNQLRVALGNASELGPGARAVALLAAQDAFRQAAQTANSDFRTCIEAVDTTP